MSSCHQLNQAGTLVHLITLLGVRVYNGLATSHRVPWNNNLYPWDKPDAMLNSCLGCRKGQGPFRVNPESQGDGDRGRFRYFRWIHIGRHRGLRGSKLATSEGAEVGGATKLLHLLLDPARALLHVGGRSIRVQVFGMRQHRGKECGLRRCEF